MGFRGVEQFKLKTIKADRPLYRDPEFKPEWPWLPAVKERHAHRIVLDDRERVACLRRFAAIPNSAVSRTQRSFDRFLRWYAEQHMRGPKQLKTAI